MPNKIDGFTVMVDEALAFCRELDATNTKEWFEPRKEHYVQNIRKPAELFCDLMADELGQMTGTGHTGKVMRIYRDVRFSKDKRPYNAHLHMSWSPNVAAGTLAPGWFFACSPDMLTLNMGLHGLDGDGLARVRSVVDRHGDELSQAIAETGFGFSAWGDAPLKKVPAPYAADNPHGDLLKRRNLILDAPLGTDWRHDGGSLLTALRAQALQMLPVWKLLQARLA